MVSKTSVSLFFGRPVKLVIDALFPDAFRIASRSRVSVYDALYVALAQREGCRLVTADEKLIKALPGYQIVSLSSL